MDDLQDQLDLPDTRDGTAPGAAAGSGAKVGVTAAGANLVAALRAPARHLGQYAQRRPHLRQVGRAVGSQAEVAALEELQAQLRLRAGGCGG